MLVGLDERVELLVREARLLGAVVVAHVGEREYDLPVLFVDRELPALVGDHLHGGEMNKGRVGEGDNLELGYHAADSFGLSFFAMPASHTLWLIRCRLECGFQHADA